MINRDKFSSAYILWLIRNKTATTWEEILKYYGLEPMNPNTLHFILDEEINKLIRKKLISVEEIGEEKENTNYSFIAGDYQSKLSRAVFSITDTTLNVLTTLDISLNEIANREYNSILVNPIFNTHSTTQKGYDLFVLMPFLNEMKPIYIDHIKNVAGDLNLSIARADDFFSANSVVDEVWYSIYKSKIIIADCSGKNPNVFYEIGIAHTIGKPVILITNNKSDIPFDLAQIRYIIYDFTSKGMKEFEKILKITISQLNRI